VELIRHRGDAPQATVLERWLDNVRRDCAGLILAFDADAAKVSAALLHCCNRR
jgi:hypothetical protein